MLWTLALVHTASAMAIDGIGRRSSSPQSPNIIIATTPDLMPKKYTVKLNENVSETNTHYLREIDATRREESASLLHPVHPFLEATEEQPQKYGRNTDYLNITMSDYSGNFTNDIISKSDSVDVVYSSGYLNRRGIGDSSAGRKKKIGKSGIIQQDMKITRVQMSQPSPDWHLSRISNRNQLEYEKAPFKFLEDVGKGVDIYIIDSGVMKTHAEFEGRVLPGPKVMPDAFDDDIDHGTCMASLAAGKISGVAKNSQVYSIKLVSKEKKGLINDELNAIRQIIKNHKEKELHDPSYQGSVINYSLGRSAGYDENDLEHKIINEAIDAGVHFVTSAGNDNRDACLETPASNRKAITVGASSKNDRKTPLSNFGPCVDIYAPGENVYCASTKGNDDLIKASGTSQSTPIVAGIIAGILSYAPHSATQIQKGTQISPANMKTLIKRIATPTAFNGILKTESIAYFGGTEAELDFFYFLLDSDPNATKISTPQFAATLPSAATSKMILAKEKLLYSKYYAGKKIDKITG